MDDPDFTTLTGSASWASALVNGDFSSFTGDPAELYTLYRWLCANRPWTVIDVARDEEGDGQDPRFTWSYGLHTGDRRYTGGSVVDYVASRLHSPEPQIAACRAALMEELRWRRLHKQQRHETAH